MKLFLRLGSEGLYYAGPKTWVHERERALSLETINRATDVGREEDLESMVIVVSYGDPGSDWFIPLPRLQMPPFQPVPASPQPPLRKAA